MQAGKCLDSIREEKRKIQNNTQHNYKLTLTKN